MIHAGLLEKLDLSQIPNRKNLDPRFTTAAYDPGNQYSIPWQWGTTGIGFDKTKVGGTVDDWDAFQKLPDIKQAQLVPRRDARRLWDGAVRPRQGPEHDEHQRLDAAQNTSSA